MAEEVAVNPLLECSAELFSITAALRGRRESADVGEDFRERVRGGFDVLERMAFERQIPSSRVQQAKYALAAYIDEVVLSSEWSGRLEWMASPLQLELFGEHLAGEGFFQRLAELRQGGEQNVDLLELYYVCLQLGFEGVYRLRGLEQLMALQVDLRDQIDGYRGVPDPRLSESGVPRASVLQRVGRHIPYWVIAAVTLAAAFFGYGGYTALNARATDDALASVIQAREHIKDGPGGKAAGGTPSAGKPESGTQVDANKEGA
jgi:type VI secretion system protein ImpK